MEISHVHQAYKLLTLLLISFANLALPFPVEFQQGSRQWHMTSDVREVAGKYYDYIVVGGGTAGCPLAATLSEKFSVLLVERGSSPFGNPLVVEKRYYGFPLLNTDEYTSVAQSFTSEDGVSNVRGRVLGGSSAINGGIYSRASEEYVSKAGWVNKQVKEAYEWADSKVVFPPVFLSPWQSVAEFSLLEAGILPYNGYSLKHIKGTKISGSVFDGFGRRHTSADLLQAANPKTLTAAANVAAKIASPYSRGKLELKNKDPRQNPAVKFNYLASEKDMEECEKMTKFLYRIARSKSITVFPGTGS